MHSSISGFKKRLSKSCAGLLNQLHILHIVNFCPTPIDVFIPREYWGFCLALLSSLLNSLASLVVSFLVGYHPYSKTSWRFILTVIPTGFLVGYNLVYQKKLRLIENLWPLIDKEKTKNFVLLLIRSILACAAVVLQYYSLKYMTLGDSAVVSYSSPVFVSIMAFFLLGEPAGLFSLFTALFTLFGVVTIIQPPFLTGQPANMLLFKGVLLAFGCTITRGLAMIVTRFIKQIDQRIILLFYGCSGTILAFALSIWTGTFEFPHSKRDMVLAALLGGLSCIGQLFMIMALQFENAGTVALVRSCDVIFSFIWQCWILGTYPNAFSFIGGSIVLSGIVLAAFQKYVETLTPGDTNRKKFWFVLI